MAGFAVPVKAALPSSMYRSACVYFVVLLSISSERPEYVFEASEASPPDVPRSLPSRRVRAGAGLPWASRSVDFLKKEGKVAVEDYKRIVREATHIFSTPAAS